VERGQHKGAHTGAREIAHRIHVETMVNGDVICVNKRAAEDLRQGPYVEVAAEVVPQDDRDYAECGRASDRCH